MSDNWETPKWVMRVFKGWYDPCPLQLTPTIDGLKSDWDTPAFVNPPYSNPMPWVERAINESRKGKTVVMLLNVDTSTKWFAKLNEAKAHFLWFGERLKFIEDGKEKDASPKPSMLVILNPEKNET